MRILGIDPGTERTGWGVVDAKGPDLSALDYGCIITRKEESLSRRLFCIYENLLGIIDKHQPEVVAIEELFFAKNAKTAIDVGHARGVAVLVVGMKGLSLEEVTPLQVKSSIVGYGNATKEQVGVMIKNILGLPRVPRPDDVCDALAVAVVAGIKRSFRAVLRTGSKVERARTLPDRKE
ncbi:MAG: crossover junction endodeoxyribonuclease RuvC [Candidatus Fermentithermobacillus carboniphilus]|uniref:Crossover junction endodeoxyribonuclease RuvC n=1 Tax=Candidatus Fermentithermobacillus carboniphilus TaxID=3085328 RepID=A0AAT9LBN0_9FIRM|nr:MAG: crossover junction endodeoxyribonuclease RuvC [Candidatus Fermentithermobacillus carboniphilus]